MLVAAVRVVVSAEPVSAALASRHTLGRQPVATVALGTPVVLLVST